MAQPHISSRVWQMTLLAALVIVGGVLIQRAWRSAPEGPGMVGAELPALQARIPLTEDQRLEREMPELVDLPDVAVAASSQQVSESAVSAAGQARDPFESWLPAASPPTGETLLGERGDGRDVSVETIQPPEVTLQGVIWDSPRPQAILDQHIVGIGQPVDEYQVTAITKEGVVLSGPGAQWLVQRQGGQVIRQRAAPTAVGAAVSGGMHESP